MQFDQQFLEEMGLGAMPESQKEHFLAYLQDELEVRIGERISEGVPEERLAEFDRVETQEEAAKWLRENRPDYREVVDRTVEEMRKEIEENRGRLLGEETEEDPETENTVDESTPESAEMAPEVAEGESSEIGAENTEEMAEKSADVI